MIDTELACQVNDKTSWCIAKANLYFHCQLQAPQISYQLRGKAAGKALLQQNQIRLNPILLVENKKAFLLDVIPHEVAHLVAFQLFGRVKPHGREWQNIMREVFQITPSTTHSFDVRSVQGKTFEYSCNCSTYPLTIRRHNKVERKQANYFCRKCTQPLQFTGKQLSG